MNKDSDTLEKIGLLMATNLYSPIQPPIYAGNAIEEMHELITELHQLQHCVFVPVNGRNGGGETFFSPTTSPDKIKDECADVIFTVLRLSNELGFTLNDLLHHALTKMLSRVKNENYNKA